MELREKAEGIVGICLKSSSTNPYEIFKEVAASEFVAIHGPEHHIVDGACILTAYANAGGQIVLEEALNVLMEEGLKMPGGICGRWGVCGAVMSVGAAMSIIDSTGPLSNDGSWGNHMKYTAQAVEKIGETKGPRCCKRDGMIAIAYGIKYVNENTNVRLQEDGAECIYSAQNAQCIKELCPYYKG